MFDEHVLENFHAGFEPFFLLLLKALQMIFIRLLRKNLNNKT